MVTTVQAKRDMLQKFIDDWGATTPYIFDNEDFDDRPATAWARVAIRHDNSTLETLGGTGNNKYERTGRLFVQIFTPLDQGTEQADSLAQTARAIFEGITLSSNAIRFNDAVVREIGPDDGWYQINVECSFRYDERK